MSGSDPPSRGIGPKPARVRSAAALLSAALSLGGATAARPIPPLALPGLGPGTSREPVDLDRPPWRGVVRVQTEVGTRCTGALVGPRAVLTAAHCLFGRGTGRLVRPGSVHVLVGYARGDYAGHARATSVVTGPGFAVGPDGQPLPSVPPDADWAVLTLDAPLGTPDRVLPLVPRVPPPGAPAMLGGYEQDRAQVLLADTACAVTGIVLEARSERPLLLRHSCAATRGVSGAPLLVRTGPPDGGWAVAGVASRAGLGVSGGFAVPVAALDPEILAASGAARRQRE
jgi:protease YdgD